MVKKKLDGTVDESLVEQETHKCDVIVHAYPVKNLEAYT